MCFFWFFFDSPMPLQCAPAAGAAHSSDAQFATAPAVSPAALASAASAARSLRAASTAADGGPRPPERGVCGLAPVGGGLPALPPLNTALARALPAGCAPARGCRAGEPPRTAGEAQACRLQPPPTGATGRAADGRSAGRSGGRSVGRSLAVPGLSQSAQSVSRRCSAAAATISRRCCSVGVCCGRGGGPPGRSGWAGFNARPRPAAKPRGAAALLPAPRDGPSRTCRNRVACASARRSKSAKAAAVEDGGPHVVPPSSVLTGRSTPESRLVMLVTPPHAASRCAFSLLHPPRFCSVERPAAARSAAVSNAIVC